MNPDSHLWRLQAGMVYQRSAQVNMMDRGSPVDKNLKRKREKTAMDYFQRVGEQSPDPRLKGFLAILEKEQFAMKSRKMLTFCENTLGLCDNDPDVLLNCVKSLTWIDRPKALELFLKACKVKSTSHILYQLGNFFVR